MPRIKHFKPAQGELYRPFMEKKAHTIAQAREIAKKWRMKGYCPEIMTGALGRGWRAMVIVRKCKRRRKRV